MRHTAHGNAGSDGCHTGHDGDMPRRRRCRTCGGGGQHRGIQRDHRHTQRAGQPAVHIRIFGKDARHHGHIHAQAGSVSGDGRAGRAVPRHRPAERRQGRHGRVRQGRLLLYREPAHRHERLGWMGGTAGGHKERHPRRSDSARGQVSGHDLGLCRHRQTVPSGHKGRDLHAVVLGAGHRAGGVILLSVRMHGHIERHSLQRLQYKRVGNRHIAFL